MTTPTASAVHVPPINQRDRIPQAAIDDVVRQIAEKFHPIKIILFGSYAYGTPRRESDVDLLVVMETSIKEIQQEILILKNIEHRFGLDILVKTPKTFNERIKIGDTFLREIAQKGKVLGSCVESVRQRDSHFRSDCHVAHSLQMSQVLYERGTR